ncbi:hypothetical protein OAY16_05665, partial [Candidatus Pelagibacter sp.]|nr:hypothetical protein [Candidatus Pelagibacter sp.]
LPVFSLMNNPDPDAANALVVLPDWAIVIVVLTIDAVGPHPCKKIAVSIKRQSFFTGEKYVIFINLYLY